MFLLTCRRPAVKASAFMIRARAHYELADFHAAIRDCDVVLTMHNKHTSAIRCRAKARSRTQQTQLAIADWGLYMTCLPNDTTALLARAALYRTLGAAYFEHALSDLNALVRLRPQSVTALNERARLLRLMKRPADAIADCTAAIELSPLKAFTFLNMRAVLYVSMSRYEEVNTLTLISFVHVINVL